jgi:hypothetical protein
LTGEATNGIEALPSSHEIEIVSNQLRISAIVSSDETEQAAFFKTAYMLDELAKRRRHRGK